MLLIIVWDGLRPDMVRTEYTPHLAQMAERGVFCRASHAAFPTATRINSASLTTGCYPGRHGLVDNELYVPELDPIKAISCADWRALQAMADLEGGRLLSVPTLGEMLRKAGKQMVSGGSGSPGTTYLTNPTVTGPIINWAVTWPQPLADRIIARYGSPLGPESSSTQRNRFVMRALSEYIIPQYEPDLVTLWLTEPDHAQHVHGLASPEALAMLREIDEEVYQFVGALEGAAPDGLNCLVISDHGFSTANSHVEPERELAQAGLIDSPDSHEIIRASDSLHLRGRSRERLGEVMRFLASRPWIGGLFLRDDLLGEYPGAMPQSAVLGNHPRSAEIMFSYRWSHEENVYGVPGSVASPGSIAATHGSASPYTINNTLIAWGPGFREGIISEVPCGIVDVAPTALHLLGIAPQDEIDGRVLCELLPDGPAPSSLKVGHHTQKTVYETASGTRVQTAHYSEVANHTYLDQVEMIDNTDR